MRKKTREVDRVQKEFTENQKALIANGVTPPEAIQMTAENKIQRVVEQCRKSHGGPISEEKELEDILESIKDEKRLKSALVAEIRYRKFTLLKIKESNPIFKQRNMSSDQLVSNIRLILQKSSVGLVCSVSLEDLEKVVGEAELVGVQAEEVAGSDLQQEGVLPVAAQDVSAKSMGTSEPWPPKIGEHLAVNVEDGFYVGEVVQIVSEEIVKVSYMLPKKISTASTELNPRLFWYWPSKQELMDTNRAAVLPLRPVLTLAAPPSTKRFVVFKLENLDFVEKFAEL